MSEAPATREERIHKISSYISRMPSLSTTLTKVLEICNSPNPSPNDLNRVISLDPVLTGQVLKVINSAYYSLPNQITSLTRAIIMLGLNTVKNLALSTAVLESLGGQSSFQALSMDEFWGHSITVGVTAKCLATTKNIPLQEREEYFVGGLLHDLGKIPLNNQFPREYLLVQEGLGLGQENTPQAESRILGIDHCIVGKMIAEKWKLSPALISSLSLHHDPDRVEDEARSFVAIVALADAYANSESAEGFNEDVPASDSRMGLLLERVGVAWETLVTLRETVSGEIEKAKVFLQIVDRGEA